MKALKKEIIYSLSGLYRDDFRVTGYRFGKGEKSCCIIGALRGDEIQQLYMCGKLVKMLTKLEKQGEIAHDKEILVIPSVNNYGINANRRFWCLDNTDINRMFPGNENGETTERIAAGVFREIKDYRCCVQFASFYISGTFVPHVRMMETGKENKSLANLFGMPFVILRNPTPLDKTTLNYNLQLSGTSAFSVYTESKEQIDEESANMGVSAVLRFLSRMGLVKYKCLGGAMGVTINEDDMMNVRSPSAGIYRSVCEIGSETSKGDVLAQIYHPYDGEVIGEITAPVDGIVFFAHNKPLIAERELAFKIVKRMHK